LNHTSTIKDLNSFYEAYNFGNYMYLSTEILIDQKPKFGTFIGVYVPSILMLFGVIIFLRLGWIVGSAGLYPSILIITLATMITLITTLSMSAASTNIQVGKGGAYYMISRALGIEMGSAIGLPLYLKQSISISFCIVGFAESFHDLLPQFSLQSIGIVTLAILTLLTYVSTQFALKIQIFIFGMIIISLYSLFSGGGSNLENASPSTQVSSISFWAIFAIFFPAMTGLESSVSLSGDLKNPSSSIPLGTITAVLTSYVIYLSISFFIWHSASQQELINDPMMIQHIAKWESLIILGIWGATLSSAIGGLLGAPRTLQALAEDKILPSFLAKEFGSFKEPRIATALTVFLALIGVCFGSVDVIAPLLTMICLICYATLNLATGLEALMANPSWRPTFPLHWTISFMGAALCIMAMLMINSGAAILAVLAVVGIYCVLKQKRLSANWEDIHYGILMYFSRLVLYSLARREPSSRCWRPNFLVFTGRPSEVSNEILSFATAITETKGFLTIASILPKDQISQEQLKEMHQNIKALLKKHHIEALVSLNQAKNSTSGMKQVILHYGLGPLTPNTIVCGGTSKEENLANYLEVIKLAHDQGRNVVIINDEQKKHSTLFGNKIKGDIHVWWDKCSPRNTELMLVLAYMLRKNPVSKKTGIYLMGLVANELERPQKQEEFNELINRNRLKIKTHVLVSPDSMQTDLTLVKSFSSQAAMIFLSMRPSEANESLEDYESYFQTLPHKSQEFPPVALVMSAQQTNLQEVMQIQAYPADKP
jgi:solute carrier family 12 (potassium/chloride transporter), member 4/6